MFQIPLIGTGKTEKKKLTTATATNVLTVTTRRAALVSVSVAEIAGAGDSISIWVTSNSVDTYIAKDWAIAANTTEVFDRHVVFLQQGDVVKVQAATADRLDVMATVIQMNEQGSS